MATGREYLASIIRHCAALQDATDAELEEFSTTLKMVDDELDSVIDYIEEGTE